MRFLPILPLALFPVFSFFLVRSTTPPSTFLSFPLLRLTATPRPPSRAFLFFSLRFRFDVCRPMPVFVSRRVFPVVFLVSLVRRTAIQVDRLDDPRVDESLVDDGGRCRRPIVDDFDRVATTRRRFRFVAHQVDRVRRRSARVGGALRKFLPEKRGCTSFSLELQRFVLRDRCEFFSSSQCEFVFDFVFG